MQKPASAAPSTGAIGPGSGPGSGPRKVALVLSGALAKGGFEAGAISELLPILAARQITVSHIVAASAGALSGTVLAAGLRAGRGPAAAERLWRFWEDEATFRMFRPSLSGITALRGLFTMAPAQALLRHHLQEEARTGEPRAPISLSIVVSRLGGTTVRIGGASYSSFEHVLHFADRDLEDQQERIIDAACASGSVPLAFTPIELRDRDGTELGPCVDGGAVNNTPIKEALRPHVDTVCIISPFPPTEPARTSYGAIELIDHLMMVLLNERLFRDLREAHWANTSIERIDRLVAQRAANPEDAARLRAELLESIGMPGARQLRILEIRPPAPLEGNSMAALFSKRLRRAYLQAGRDAVRAMTDTWT